MKKKNILVITESYPSKKRPFSGLFVHKLMVELKQKGHNILVISPRGARSNFSTKPEYRDGILSVYPSISNIFRNSKNNYFFHKEISSIANKCKNIVKEYNFNPDLVYAHFVYCSGLVAFEYCKGAKLPYYLMLGESYLDELLNKLKNSDIHKYNNVCLSLNSAESVMCVSKKLQKVASQNSNNKQIFYVPNGVNINIFKSHSKSISRKALSIDHDGVLIGFVGTLSKRKGIDILFNLQKVISSNCKLAVASSTKISNVNGLIFNEFVENDRLPLFLCSCDIFVFPTKAEGMSNALLEAMACGLIIVTSDIEENREFLNENNAILVDFEDRENFLNVVRNVSANIRNYKYLGVQAQKDVQHYGLSRRVEGVEKLIVNI